MNFDFVDVTKFKTLIESKLQIWIEEAIKLLPNLVMAFITILLFSLIARYAAKLARNILKNIVDSAEVINLLTSILRVIIFIAGLFIALDFMSLKGTVTSLLAGAGIVGLAIGFAFQDMTENLISGITMSIKKPFKIGDIIEAEGVFGNVKAIKLRNTLVETFSGQLKIIPNKILFRNILTNYSSTHKRRIELDVGISYADDPQQASDVIVNALNNCDFVIDKSETAAFAKEFGASSVNLIVWFWIDFPGNKGFMQARHDAVINIKKALEKEDILIPFPIRTLDFGIKGGESLRHSLPQNSANTTS
ncbi:mechanosensitive ion channel family protein [uncultured Psychrosphaera sp.]|uniref:mechanosensitive ion channel family protein n=1 Tax=uncultured Psychrosphaera sp. TaxID=1403522 RepID=UPI002615AFBA|nr:mechanosensitive ion channel family protein [uncultured Psychrosphaera sp.]